jgi:putative tricarboxylic transport membrane protein
MKRDELIGGVIVFLFGGFTVFLSLQMPLGTFRMAGSGLFPFWLGIILMVLSLLFLLRLLKVKVSLPEVQNTVHVTTATKQMLLFLGATMLATFGITVVGYPLTTFLLMLLLLIILGVKGRIFILILSLLAAISCYLLFVRWLKIPLPKGIIGL